VVNSPGNKADARVFGQGGEVLGLKIHGAFYKKVALLYRAAPEGQTHCGLGTTDPKGIPNALP